MRVDAPRLIREHCTGSRTFDCAFRSLETEQRADGSTSVRGVAAVFDSDSEILYGSFVERINRGAFTNALRSDPDVRFLVNHEGLPYARTTNGTLRLEQTQRGLEFEADIADTQAGNDLRKLIARGDVDQMSFAFTVADDEWREGGKHDIRTIREIGELYEISAVTFPAYQATTAEVVSRPEAPADEQRDQAEGSEQIEQAQPDASPLEVENDRATAIRAWLAIHS